MAEGDDDGATRFLKLTEDFGDTYVEVEAWSVPESDRYPEGVKYSFQYGNTAGETVIRYDNFPDHPDIGRHHKHRSSDPDDVVTVDFNGLESLFKRFKQEVKDHGEPW